MNEPIKGSVEMLTGDHENVGIPGERWTTDVVPVVLETLYGVTQLVRIAPAAQPTGRTPAAQWNGVNADGQPVTVLLWEDIPYETTAVARAIAQAIAEDKRDG